MSTSGTPPRPPTQLVPSSREPERELVRRDRDVGLLMVCSPDEARRRLQELQAFVKSVMVEGVDFMSIVEGQKPTLLQPGAQKLAELYGFAHRWTNGEIVRDWERGFFYFETTCILTLRRSGDFVGEGFGSCNSKETKYSQRWVQAKDVPPGTNLAKLQSRERPSKFPGGKPYTVYLVDAVPNAADLPNTLAKMSRKRSYVHAVTGVTRSSGLFTQDIEDLPEEAYGAVERVRPWEREREIITIPYEAPPAPVAPVVPPVVHRDTKPDNYMTATEAKAMRELAPALERATSPEEVEVLRKEAVQAAPLDPANPRKRQPTSAYLSWYQSAVRAAQVRVGAS